MDPEQDRGTDMELEQFFHAARQPEPVPGALMARVLADAAQVQASQAMPAADRKNLRTAPGLWRRMSAALGGSGALAGMLAAGMAGVWIGFAQPLVLPFALDSVELIPADDDFWFALTEEAAPEG